MKSSRKNDDLSLKLDGLLTAGQIVEKKRQHVGQR